MSMNGDFVSMAEARLERENASLRAQLADLTGDYGDCAPGEGNEDRGLDASYESQHGEW
jgi:hypothetical protein